MSRIAQLRMRGGGVVHRGGVGHDDVCAEPTQTNGDVEGGAVADVVAERLERGTEYSDPTSEHEPAQGVHDELDRPFAAPEVDRVHLVDGTRPLHRDPAPPHCAANARMSFGRQPPPKPMPAPR